MLGTQNGRLIKFYIADRNFSVDLNDNYEKHETFVGNVSFIYQVTPKSGSFLPDPVLDTNRSLLYMLSEHSVTSIPVDRCLIYRNCAACFRSSENCVWQNGSCKKRDVGKYLYIYCDPVVYYFEPKTGPINGGTVITFHGSNFGLDDGSKRNSNIGITLGDISCKVTERTDKVVRCLTPPIESTVENLTKGQYLPLFK